MSDRPIIFSAPMVRALLDGRKTQTRRLAWRGEHDVIVSDEQRWALEKNGWQAIDGAGEITTIAKPTPWQKVRPGDRLWVRENIWQASSYPGTLPSGEPEPAAWCWGSLAHHAADGDPPNAANRHYGPGGLAGGSFAAPDPYAVWIKRPSIHMPRWASRLTLTVTDIRVQRLREISEGDAKAEGIWRNDNGEWLDYPAGSSAAGWLDPRSSFRSLWNSLHGPDAWDNNPAVVAISFAVERRNVDG